MSNTKINKRKEAKMSKIKLSTALQEQEEVRQDFTNIRDNNNINIDDDIIDNDIDIDDLLSIMEGNNE